MDAGDHPVISRQAALDRVYAYRERCRARPTAVRAALAVLGGVLFIVSIPLVVLLPEAGIPALLVALRLMAVEFHWAANGYAWTDWRFSQLLHWFHGRSRLARWTIMAALLLAAAALVWLLIEEL
ncbi:MULTISPECIES: hypothetical protein [Mycobacterium]|uniref:TIGR02611 family protein n=1 Tax=Mycobacterium gordonae TaxID=1778 RepID=A0A1A6BPC6_MYCGO|nr:MULTISPECIES: hypothetical protein [Mycobacterium]MBI2701131.1 hypothetical protein [Mycobacterium sp.]MCQ4362255.1 hypothetical protein [Mycobacterium gordonae]MCV7006997.1 hypothetical protein [Mycobacterium gordonae]OBS04059.1 hypothetical protein A9W98_06370 [Mycobacterium gordonae]ODR23174.1 hypothetical protein BHQ23_06045 [Mycobacterium gordonae]